MSNCVTNFEMSNILPGKKSCQDKNNESQVVQTTPIKKKLIHVQKSIVIRSN